MSTNELEVLRPLFALAGTLAGIYGLNSAARVWRNGSQAEDQKG